MASLAKQGQPWFVPPLRRRCAAHAVVFAESGARRVASGEHAAGIHAIVREQLIVQSLDATAVRAELPVPSFPELFGYAMM